MCEKLVSFFSLLQIKQTLCLYVLKKLSQSFAKVYITVIIHNFVISTKERSPQETPQRIQLIRDAIAFSYFFSFVKVSNFYKAFAF